MERSGIREPFRQRPGLRRYAAASGLHVPAREFQTSNAGSFFRTGAFFRVTYSGNPFFPYGGGASPRMSGDRYARGGGDVQTVLGEKRERQLFFALWAPVQRRGDRESTRLSTSDPPPSYTL